MFFFLAFIASFTVAGGLRFLNASRIPAIARMTITITIPIAATVDELFELTAFCAGDEELVALGDEELPGVGVIIGAVP